MPIIIYKQKCHCHTHVQQKWLVKLYSSHGKLKNENITKLTFTGDNAWPVKIGYMYKSLSSFGKF